MNPVDSSEAPFIPAIKFSDYQGAGESKQAPQPEASASLSIFSPRSLRGCWHWHIRIGNQDPFLRLAPDAF